MVTARLPRVGRCHRPCTPQRFSYIQTSFGKLVPAMVRLSAARRSKGCFPPPGPLYAKGGGVRTHRRIFNPPMMEYPIQYTLAGACSLATNSIPVPSPALDLDLDSCRGGHKVPEHQVPLVLEHGIPYSTVQCVPHPPACSESEVISRTCRPNPARPDGETNLSRGEGGVTRWALGRQVAFPHAPWRATR